MKIDKRFIALFVALLLLVGAVGVARAQTEQPAEATWYARYWNNTDLSGSPVVERNEVAVQHDWGFDSPHPDVNADNFSARWTSFVHFEAGTYRFTVTSDDGVRVWVDDQYVVNSWLERPATTETTTVTLQEGDHAIAVDYFDARGQALISLTWERADGTGNEQVDISPLQGPVGTVLQVSASGFTPNSVAYVGIGRANSEPTDSKSVPIDAAGRVETTIAVPQTAEAGEPWRVLVRSGRESALSQDFIVTQGPQETMCGDTYVVRPGDWLSRIARNCGTTTEALLALNPSITDPNVLFVGQVLQLPAGQDLAAQVSITPDSGTVGTEIQVNAIGFPPNTQVTVGIGRANSEPTTSMLATTDAAGTLETTIQVPLSAGAGEPWVVLVSSTTESALSEPFTVTQAGVSATPLYNLRLRAGPGTNFERIDGVPAGTMVPVVGRNLRGDWLQVNYDDTVGWIAGWLSNVSGDLDDVPVTSEQ